MAYSTIDTQVTGAAASVTWANLIRSNQEDHETRIVVLEGATASINRKYISGLEISNGTDTDHDIDIAVGQAADGTNTRYLELDSVMTKQIDATWAKGTNAGGLDTGTVANATFYYFWIIEQDSTNDIDILISASQTSPTMPSGWTAKRRIRGAVLTDGSANILEFRQKDNDFRYLAFINNYDSSATTSRTTQAVSVPPGFMGNFSIMFQETGTTAYCLFQEISDTDRAPGPTDFDFSALAAATRMTGAISLQVDSTSLVAFRVSAVSSNVVRINTKGFTDNAQ